MLMKKKKKFQSILQLCEKKKKLKKIYVYKATFNFVIFYV